MTKATKPDPLYELRPKIAKELWAKIGDRASITLTRAEWRKVCQLVGARAPASRRGRPKSTSTADRDIEMARDYLYCGESAAELSKKFHVDERTVRRAITRYRALLASIVEAGTNSD